MTLSTKKEGMYEYIWLPPVTMVADVTRRNASPPSNGQQVPSSSILFDRVHLHRTARLG